MMTDMGGGSMNNPKDIYMNTWYIQEAFDFIQRNYKGYTLHNQTTGKSILITTNTVIDDLM